MVEDYLHFDKHGKPVTTLTFPEDEYILMQYFGLKDKNGKEIYDGDILKYHNGRFSEPIEFPKDYIWIKVRTEDSRVTSSVEVIGNIYENPELLRNT